MIQQDLIYADVFVIEGHARERGGVDFEFGGGGEVGGFAVCDGGGHAVEGAFEYTVQTTPF